MLLKKYIPTFRHTLMLLFVIGAIAISFFAYVQDSKAIVPVHCPTICRTWDEGLNGPLLGVCSGWFVSKEYIDIGCSPGNSVDSQNWNEALGILINFKDAFIEWVKTGQDDFFTGGTQGTLFVTNNYEWIIGAAENQSDILEEEFFGDAYESLCSPFRDQVGVNAFTDYGRDYGSFGNKARCTLELDEGISLENFYADMLNGGWDAYFHIAQNFYTHTPFGLETLIRNESMLRMAAAEKANELDFLAGNGFPGLRACDEVTREGRCWKYVTNTPGKIVQEQLSDALRVELHKLEAADEAEEVVTDSFDALNAWIWSGGSQGQGILGGSGQPPGGGGGGQGQCNVATGRPNFCSCQFGFQCASLNCSQGTCLAQGSGPPQVIELPPPPPPPPAP